jgi:hypothetical protein
MRVLRVGVELVESKTPLCPISLNSAVDILAKNKHIKKDKTLLYKEDANR